MPNRCRRCGGVIVMHGRSRYGNPFGSCLNCGNDPAIKRRPGGGTERPATRGRATLTRYDDAAIRTLIEGSNA